uniref:Bm3815 n=1 Tax=Brugia malayi TaxID=6279 RepID=A0A1I9GE34_BRUMA|nr:Bm3815 [Brugia malayi]
MYRHVEESKMKQMMRINLNTMKLYHQLAVMLFIWQELLHQFLLKHLLRHCCEDRLIRSLLSLIGSLNIVTKIHSINYVEKFRMYWLQVIWMMIDDCLIDDISIMHQWMLI